MYHMRLEIYKTDTMKFLQRFVTFEDISEVLDLVIDGFKDFNEAIEKEKEV